MIFKDVSDLTLLSMRTCTNTPISTCECDFFFPPPIWLHKSLCVFSNTGLTVCVSVYICTHTHFLYQGHQTCAPTHPLHDLWVSVCVSVCVCLSMSTLFCCWGTLAGWGEWVEWVGVEGGEPLLDARLVFTLAVLHHPHPPQDPAPVRCWNRWRPYCPPPQLGAEHTTVAEQGSNDHPTNWMGTLWRGSDWLDQPWHGLLTNAAHYEKATV